MNIKMKLLIILASYAGLNSYTSKSRNNLINSDNIVNLNCKNLLSVKTSYEVDIIISRAKVENNIKEIPNYYDGEYVNKTRLITVRNENYSVGQFFQIYEQVKGKYEYYLLLEDDYTMSWAHYDKILIDNYKEKFPDNIGLLASSLFGKNRFHEPQFKIDIWGGLFMLSENSMKQIYSKYKNYNNISNYLKRKWFQISFGEILINSNIKQESILNISPYIHWVNQHKNFNIFTDEKIKRKIIKYTDFNDINLIQNSICLPIQLIRKVIIYFTKDNNDVEKLLEMFYNEEEILKIKENNNNLNNLNYELENSIVEKDNQMINLSKNKCINYIADSYKLFLNILIFDDKICKILKEYREILKLNNLVIYIINQTNMNIDQNNIEILKLDEFDREKITQYLGL